MDIVDPIDFNKQELLDIMAERLKINGRKFSNEEDNIDIARVVRYKRIRKIGEVPDKIGLF